MRTTWSAALALSALLGALAPPSMAQESAGPQARVIVKFKPGTALARERTQAASAGPERAQALGRRLGVALAPLGTGGERLQVVTARGLDAEALARRLAADPDVEYAEPDVRHRRLAAPNDPRYATVVGGGGPLAGQWYLKPPSATFVSAINAEAAWDVTTGSPSVVVAVLDTGVRYDHPDLQRVASGGNLLNGYDMIKADVNGTYSTAGDGDGRDADASDPGDFVSAADRASGNFNGCAEEPSSWHGTQTASLVGALTDNGIGMASVGRTVQVLPVRVLGKCGGYTSDIADGIRWAAGVPVAGVPDNTTPAKVINLSLGGDGACSRTYQEAIDAAIAQGAVVVVSAGNSAGHAVSSPANCRGVIAVTALRHAGSKVGFADVGPEVAIAAPGGNCGALSGPCLYPIITATNAGTTTPAGATYTDGLDPAYGTSFAAPLVAGTVGLMLSVRPDMAVPQVRAALLGSTRRFPVSGGEPGMAVCRAPDSTSQDECYCTTSTCGAGMLDTHAAVLGAQRGLQARITPNVVAPRAGQALTLSAGGSYALAPITGHQWTLVDGGGIVAPLAAATGPTLTVTPSATGRFIVRLTVTDRDGAQSTSEQTVHVGAPALVIGGDGGGGGALGMAWLAGLALAVAALQAQRHRACSTRASRRGR